MAAKPARPITPPRLSGPSVLGWVLPHLLAWVERQGVDASAIRQLPGLDGLDDPDARVPEASAEQAWQLAAAATRDDAIGVHVAETLPRGALDLVEYAFRSSASLAVGLARLTRYAGVMSDRVASRMEAAADGLLIFFRDTGGTALHPARAEFALAAVIKLARDTTGVAITPAHVCFTHGPHRDVSEHERFFGRTIRFNAATNSVLLRAADAARPLREADEALSEIVRRRLEKALAGRESSNTGLVSGRVRRLLVEGFGQKPLTPDMVAAMLSTSRRTLARRLADEGTSFTEILDAVRSELAQLLLRDPSLSIGDIAFFLHYSEPAAFHRSFRRWTGQTPAAFRKS